MALLLPPTSSLVQIYPTLYLYYPICVWEGLKILKPLKKVQDGAQKSLPPLTAHPSPPRNTVLRAAHRAPAPLAKAITAVIMENVAWEHMFAMVTYRPVFKPMAEGTWKV